MYLGVDPGDTTGLALISLPGPVIEYTGQLRVDEVLDWLEENKDKIRLVVCEDFILYAHKAYEQRGSHMVASQVIGILKGFCMANKLPLIMQPASIKSMAEKKTKLRPPSDHSKSHWIDAYNHVMYYLIGKGLARGVRTNRNSAIRPVQ